MSAYFTLGPYGKKIARIHAPNHKLDGEIIHLFESDKDYICCTRCDSYCLMGRKCCKYCKIEFNNKTNKTSCCGGGKGNNILPDSYKFVFNLPRNKHWRLIPLPDFDINTANHLLCSGPTGCGKSTFIGNYIREILNYDNKKVYLFSASDKDSALDEYNPIRITKDEMNKGEFDIDNFRNSIVIFDDIDRFENNLSNIIRNFRDKLLEEGRKLNIHVLCTSHQLYNFLKSRDMINECSKITLFHNGLSPNHTIKFLRTTCGLDSKCIKYIQALEGRYIMVYKNYPQFLLSENSAIVLNKLPSYLNNNKNLEIM